MSSAWHICAGFLALATLAAAMYLRRATASAAGGELPRCGHCGYATIGLPSSICPECGSDLAVVGTRRPSRWALLTPEGRLRILVAAWTLWVFLAAALARRPFEDYLQPGIATRGEQVGLVPEGQHYNIQVGRVWRAWVWPWQASPLVPQGSSLVGWYTVIQDDLSGGCGPFAEVIADWHPERGFCGECNGFMVNTQRGLIASYDPTTKTLDVQQNAAGSASLDVWLARCSEHAQSPELPGLVTALINAVNAAPPGQVQSLLLPGYRFSMSGYDRGWRPDTRFSRAALVPAGILWLVGTFAVMRRHRRRPSADARRLT